jgi:hypothetical protein
LKEFSYNSIVGTPILKQHCAAYYVDGAYEYIINKAQTNPVFLRSISVNEHFHQNYKNNYNNIIDLASILSSPFLACT